MERKMKYVSPFEFEAEQPFPVTSGRSMTLDESVNLMSRLALISPSIKDAAVPGLPTLTPPQAHCRAISVCSMRRRYK